MTKPDTIKMTLTFDVAEENVVAVESDDKKCTPKDLKIPQAVDENGTKMKIACVVLYKETNPLCFYYYLPNGEEIQICF